MGRPLGQHFLKDQNIINKIVSSAKLEVRDKVLEIGPGQGAITDKLLQKAGHVTAIELDSQLVKKLAVLPNLHLINSDILKIDLAKLLTSTASENPNFKQGEHSWKVVANLPYYITSPILEKILSESGKYLDYIVVMIQREVAERIATIASRETGSLSYFVNYYANVEYLFTVKPTCFAPPPKVDSAVIKLTMHRQPPVAVSPKILFTIIRTAFQERRKTLKRSLLKLPYSLTPNMWEQIWKNCGVDPQRRPETLTLAEFASIAEQCLEFQNAT